MKKTGFLFLSLILLAVGLVLAGCDLLEAELPGLTGTVTIDNTSPKVGDTLTATYSGNGTGDASWQWLRDETSISDATASTYTVVTADVGKTLKAQVSYKDQKGIVVSTATMATASAIEEKPVLTGTVTIDNTLPRVGDILTAIYSGGNGSGTATWQWSRDSNLIGGATRSAYDVVTEDIGYALWVRVRFANQSGSVTSRVTSAVVATGSADN